MIIWTHVMFAGVWGGLLALERRAFLQAMFSRPLVAATGMGLLLEDVPSGLFVGMVLELFLLGTANLGAALPENDTLAATCTSAASAAMAHALGGGTPAVWSLAILLFVGMGRVGRSLDRTLERYSARLARRAMRSAETGELNRAVRQNLWGMWPHFVLFGALTAASAVVGYLLAPHVRDLSPRAMRALAWAFPAMASVAAAIAARGSRATRAALYAGISAAAVTALAGFASFGGKPW